MITEFEKKDGSIVITTHAHVNGVKTEGNPSPCSLPPRLKQVKNWALKLINFFPLADGSVVDNSENLAVSETTASILRKNTSYMWSHPQQDWAGIDKAHLTETVGVVGELLDIKPHQARRIEIIFGDHIDLKFPNGEKYINTAFCITDFNGRTVKRNRVVLNRSSEILEHKAKISNQENEIICIFEEPYENIVWLISEELKHAQIWCISGNKSVESRWQKKYIGVMGERGVTSSDNYDKDIQEITASRCALRVLMKIVPQRARYYRDLYEKSLALNYHVTPGIGKVEDKTYIKTGFKPLNSEE